MERRQWETSTLYVLCKAVCSVRETDSEIVDSRVIWNVVIDDVELFARIVGLFVLWWEKVGKWVGK